MKRETKFLPGILAERSTAFDADGTSTRKMWNINLQNTEYGGMVDRQHAVLNYAAGQWYIEDLGSRNGVRIQDAKDGKTVSGFKGTSMPD